jgi:hypothetical protein
MGPHNEANSVIGRAYTLMSKTMGGLHSGKTTWSSLGSTMQHNNVCIAENEQALPEGWEPLDLQMGFKPNDSVITVGIGWFYEGADIMTDVQESRVTRNITQPILPIRSKYSISLRIVRPALAPPHHEVHIWTFRFPRLQTPCVLFFASSTADHPQSVALVTTSRKSRPEERPFGWSQATQ